MSLPSIGRDICKVDPTLKYTCKRGHVRITPIGFRPKLSKDEQVDILTKSGKQVLEIIPPKNLQSKSSKFLTYKISNKDNFAYVVFGLGVAGNAGLSYERQKADEIQDNIVTGNTNEIVRELKCLLGSLDVVGVTKNYNSKVERPLDLSPKNVDKVISDIILKDITGKDIYVSLKSDSGNVIVSHGVSGSFSDNENNITYHKGNNIDLLLQEVNVDVNKMVLGFNEYSNKIVSNKERKEVVDVRYPDNLKDLLAAAYGYGYYLAKETEQGKCEIIDLTTLENLNNYIGNVLSVELYYPYYLTEKRNVKCKSMIIKIQTDKHGFQFVIRNRAGFISPNTLELIKL